ncbi:hypothetical protein NI17_022445 [Thermobifida halotolerans]|uniref:Uncharacterized protein n=1 Tax=Thermobifida halotolerans TaxID=483545 RepID=A0A399FWG7_9ACTN|nr:hypothetical protein [Thermobifida halotolerans]UOE19446.1 hypothetical protein NI17_022445 [Thermobifida halotolerans]
MAAEQERLKVSPGEMARVAAALYEPADLTRKTFANLRIQREALGRPWGEGDEIAQAAEKDLVPMIEMLDELGVTLVEAFTHTAENTIATAKSFHAAEEIAVENSNSLRSGFNGSDSGSGSGSSGRR